MDYIIKSKDLINWDFARVIVGYLFLLGHFDEKASKFNDLLIIIKIT